MPCLFQQIRDLVVLNVNSLRCALYWADNRCIIGALFSEMDSETEAGDLFSYKPLKLKRKRCTPRRREVINIAKGTTDPGVDYFDQLFWLGRFG